MIEMNAAASETERYVEVRSRVTSRVKGTLIDVLQLEITEEQIGFDSPLFGAGLGLDSVDAVGLAAAIEQEFGVTVLDSDIQVFRSINTIVDFVIARQAQTEAGEEPSGLAGVVVPEDLAARAEAAPGLEEELADYLAVRCRAGLVDQSRYAKIRVDGADAQELLDRVVAGNVADLAVGEMLHSLALAEDGTVQALLWLARDDRGYLLLAGAGQREVLLAALSGPRAELAVEVADVTGEYGLFSLLGPRAQDLLVDLFDEDLLRLGYAEWSERDWDGVRIAVGRFGETGEFDYRLLAPVEAAARLRREVEEAGSLHGLRVCSPAVLPGLMLEMKSIHQEAHLPPGATPAQLDLQWMLQASKERFIGREAALAGLRSPGGRAVVLVLDEGVEGGADLRGAGVLSEGRPVGTVQAASRSWVLDRALALALLDEEAAWPNLRFEVAGAGGAESRSAPLFLTRTVVESLNL
jgi:acyl carrier protein